MNFFHIGRTRKDMEKDMKGKKRFITLLLSLSMIFVFSFPTTVLAMGNNPDQAASVEEKPESVDLAGAKTQNGGATKANVKKAPKEALTEIYVDAKNGSDGNANVGASWETAYKNLYTAVKAAPSGATIYLSDAKYTLYKMPSEGATKGKSLTFVGQGAGKTGWCIGAEVPDPDKFGTEYNGDYSFDGAENVIFKNMTLQSASKDYLGFIRPNHTVVENCVVNGKTFYWGYRSATFRNTVFNCPGSDYCMWTYSSDVMNFEACTFNGAGKILNVYRDSILENGAGSKEKPVIINYSNCTVDSTEANKSALNIKDKSGSKDLYFVVNFSGNNKVEGLNSNKYTCSSLFQVEGVAENYNLSGGSPGKEELNITPHAIVNINGKTVWEKGKMVNHDYTDGAREKAYEVISGAWVTESNGAQHREVKTTCKKCGHSWVQTQTIPAPTTPTTPPTTPTTPPAGGGGAPVGPVLVAVAGGAVPTANVDATEDLLEVEDEDTPLAKGLTEHWALVNLILAIFTALVSVLLIVFYFKGKNDDDDEESEEKRMGIFRILSLVPALASVALFILTEDMSLPMAMTDKWTLLMAVFALLNVVFAFLSKKQTEDEEEAV